MTERTNYEHSATLCFLQCAREKATSTETPIHIFPNNDIAQLIILCCASHVLTLQPNL